MTRSKPEEELDVADQFLNYDGEVTMTVEAEGTSVDNPEQDTSATDKIEDQQQTSTPKDESQKNEDPSPSNEKENKDPEEVEDAAPEQTTNGNEKGEKDDDDSEEVYEVEAVVDHHKRRNKTYYLIKWKGYSEEESTWEAEDNVFAEDLVKEYWQKLNAEETKTKETRKGRKRAAAAPPTPTKKESKKTRMSTPKRAKTTRVKIDEEFDHDEDWESLVSGVETVTRDDKTGELLVYLKWKNGDTSRHPAREANIKCPQKMIRFYEQRLTFAAPQPKS